VKLDAHVHTLFSGKTTIYPVHKILNESYNPPELVYSRAKARGMDLVAITDHDTIDGALTLADRPDLIIGEEITAIFPEDNVTVHLGVLDINEQQHREIQRLRRNIRELMPYLKSQGIFTTLNHLASQTAGRLTAAHIAALIPWVDGLEVLNGTRLPSQNRTAAALAEAYGKVGVAGSDASRTGVGGHECRNKRELHVDSLPTHPFDGVCDEATRHVIRVARIRRGQHNHLHRSCRANTTGTASASAISA